MESLNRSWQTASGYGVAIAAVGLALGARELFTPLWGPSFVPFIFFFPAIALAAWYGRWGPALLAIERFPPVSLLLISSHRRTI